MKDKAILWNELKQLLESAIFMAYRLGFSQGSKSLVDMGMNFNKVLLKMNELERE